MPTMANITVKKNDGTTDIVYDALSGSGGDNTPASWRQDTGEVAGKPMGLRKTFEVKTKWNGPKTARQLTFQYVGPYAVQDSTTTLYSAKDRLVFTGIMTVPMAIPSSEINEFVSQAVNLLASTLIKDSAKAGFAPV